MRLLEVTKHYTSDSRYALKYYTTSAESRLNLGGMLYGIRIEKYIFNDGKEQLMEENECPGVTYECDKAKKIAGILARGLVTPMMLDCVLDELHE